MQIFSFENYKAFALEKIKGLPKKGHGEFLRISRLLGVHTTMITHIFRGEANLSVEQALKLSDSWGFNPLETDYFVNLVLKERAANPQSIRFFERKLADIRKQALKLSERLQERSALSEADQAIFYSSWFYSGVRLITATEKFTSAEAIARRLDLELAVVNKALDFLLSRKLLKIERGVYAVEKAQTYIGSDSIWVNKHHFNWRMKGLEQVHHIPEDELSFTSAITVSKQDFNAIREEIIALIQKFRTIATPSAPETLCFLNVDWRKVKRNEG